MQWYFLLQRIFPAQKLNPHLLHWQADSFPLSHLGSSTKELVRRAGAHVWCDSGDPVEANDCLFSLHARASGRKRVRLPRKAASVVDVFGKRVVARDVDEFEFYAPLHSSHLFYLEKP